MTLATFVNNPPPTPSAPEAEAALLGSILLDPSVLGGISLTPGAFYLEKHSWIFSALRELENAGEPIDFLTVLAKLERRGQLDKVGGSAYLTTLLNAAPTAAHYGHYAKLISEAAFKRQVLGVTERLAGLAFDKSGPGAAKLLAEGQKLIGDLRTAQQDQGNTDPWQQFSLKDAYAERPPIEYIAAGLFAASSLSVIYGAPGTLKSMLLADLCVCVAAGRAWLPALPNGKATAIPTTQAPALWLDFDNGKRRTDERFDALARARNLPDTTPLFYYSMPSPWLDAGNHDAQGDLAERIRARGAKLVVLDNLGVVTGKADENAPEIATILANFRWLAEKTGAAVVLIHHQRKSNGINGRAGDSLRGHSSIEAALDLALLVEREDRSANITIKATKARGADVLPFGALFAYEPKSESSELGRACFYGEVIEDVSSDRAIARTVIEVVTANRPINQSRIAKEVQVILPTVGRDRIFSIANRLAMDGKLRMTSGTHGAKLYDLASVS